MKPYGIYLKKEIKKGERKMNRIDRLKKFLDDNYIKQGNRKIQTFFCRNNAGDVTDAVYNEDNIIVLECSYYDYIEILGLTDKEKEDIRKYGYNEHR